MIRNVVVPKSVPMCSTGMLYSNVSLPCEPWETPAPPKKSQNENLPIAEPDPELLILEAVKSGANLFGDIVSTVFGPRMGSVDDKARSLMKGMMKRGLLQRHRSEEIPGKPYIWEIANGS